MTDNEIIKALEYCQSETTENCNKCPLVFKGACQQECLRKAFDLINRQQAEIEKQRIMLEAIEDAVNPLPFETDYDKSIKQAKSEAIKEFAERLKAKFADIEYVIKTHRKTLPVERVKAEVDAVLQNGCSNIIDKVLKEMEGEDK